MAVAGLRLTLDDGTNLADRIDPRFISLRLTEKRDEEADQLELVLSNADGALTVPDADQTLSLQLGWVSGSGVPVGLVDKGIFTVDEVEESFSPDQVSIRARSANLTGTYRQRRDRTWRETTLEAILTAIAAEEGGIAKVEPSLAATAIDVIEQAGKSNMAFVRDLGRRFDAAATWKSSVLIFLPIGRGVSASGRALEAGTLLRRDTTKSTFTHAKRGEYDGAEAQWQDTGAGRRRTVTTGGENRRRLERVYASEDEANQAAQSATSRGEREPVKFECGLSFADCSIGPETPLTLSGWNSRIDEQSWTVEEVNTSLDATGGLSQTLKLEGA